MCSDKRGLPLGSKIVGWTSRDEEKPRLAEQTGLSARQGIGFGQMKRRAFLGKLGGIAFRLAAAACAQQRSKRIVQTAKEI